MSTFDLEYIRSQIIGNDLIFRTPFGERLIMYADYTASGRGLRFIEEKILNIEKSYANTHTEDDYSGKYLTQLFHKAQKKIKDKVNAGEKGKIISVGSGSTEALKKLQEIMGISIPPVTRERIFRSIAKSGKKCDQALKKIQEDRPAVFIGPYEHHTNELMWREALAEVVVIGLDWKGRLDLQDLQKKISDRKYTQRFKLASFSAGSNVTGIRTEVYEVARICHENDTLIFFDFAAVAPYVEINMNRDGTSYFDAVFFSPHKFLGGPGSSGLLVFREELYRSDLPPTTAGGGTVDYVGFHAHDFSKDIETRETAGTPPILQTIKAAMAMEVKEKIGVERIERIEAEFTKYVLSRLRALKNIVMVGRIDPEEKIPIISFNVRHSDRILHPKFVTKLLNDLFGIQSRAGCSCAGPYGHILLDISDERSREYRKAVSQGWMGLKPGWVRINIHYTFTRSDVDFLVKAIQFVAEKGHLFLPLYDFDMNTGEWSFRGFREEEVVFSIENDFDSKSVDVSNVEEARESYFREAENLAQELSTKEMPAFAQDEEEIEQLKTFYYVNPK